MRMQAFMPVHQPIERCLSGAKQDRPPSPPECPVPPLPCCTTGSLSLDDVIRDLLFEPASLDDWLAPGKSWEDAPPQLTAASEHGRGGRGILCRLGAAAWR